MTEIATYRPDAALSAKFLYTSLIMGKKSCGFFLGLACLGAAGCGDLAIQQAPSVPVAPPQISSAIPSRAAAPAKTDPQINNALVDLIDSKGRFKLDLSNIQGTPLNDILTVGSPIGYNLRNRYLNLGVPLAEALSRDTDPDFKDKLVTFARWDRDAETRSAGLIAVARNQDVNDMRIFQEALVHLNSAVRFGALEALQVWGHPEKSVPLLAAVAEKDYDPLLRVYAAGALARLGDDSGLHRLRDYLDNPSWLVRAMAARYLGDYGTAEDYDLLVSHIGRELSNNFVLAENCVGALKLFPKKNP